MSEKGRAVAARKGPAKLGGDLDEVFATKKETSVTAPGSDAGNGTAANGTNRMEPEPAGPLVRGGVTSSTIRIPHYLSDRISDYLHANKGDTLTTLFFKGLMKLGIEVEPGDLVPKRQRRSR